MDVRVPPQTIIRCQQSFAKKGLEYFDVPDRSPTKREVEVEKMLDFLENPPASGSPSREKIRVRYIGHEFSAEQIRKIRMLISENPTGKNLEFARSVCTEFGLYQANGQLKTVQVSQILLRMQMDNMIALPFSKVKDGGARVKPVLKTVLPPRKTIELESRQIEHLNIVRARTKKELSLWRELIENYHYIGRSTLFGRQMRYLVFGQGGSLEQIVKDACSKKNAGQEDEEAYKSLFDGDRLLLGALGFAGAAWRLSSREYFIGWDDKEREKNLDLVVNNSRFLILPWIKSPNLASRILGAIARRLPGDWQEQYARRPVLLETFVGLEKFKGTCYRAANWIQIGVTEGYSLYPRYKNRAETKGIFVYPLDKNFRKILCGSK